jgi:hypothetical protein
MKTLSAGQIEKSLRGGSDIVRSDPKPKRKRKAYTVPGASDSTLMALWRKAVKAKWGKECALAGETNGPDYKPLCFGAAECHHIKHRRIPHLRYCPENGIPLCKVHHGLAEYGLWRKIIEEKVGGGIMMYLDKLESMLFPDFLKWNAMTRIEWRKLQKNFLTNFVAKNEKA